MRVRTESFGAWIALDDGTLVAVTQERARALGVAESPKWAAEHQAIHTPLEAHVAITSQCAVGCEGCYQNATPNGTHVSLAQLEKTFASLAAQSVFTVALGGGEPLSHPELATIARNAKQHGLSCVVTTSGVGLLPSHDLSAFSQVNVSHDGLNGAYVSVRGVNAQTQAEAAIMQLVAQGVRVGVNYVLTRDSFAQVEDTAKRAVELGVVELQLLRYKPSGRAASLDYLDKRLSLAQVDAFAALLQRLSLQFESKLSIRVDCALVPFLSETSLTVAQLEQWGVFGCEAGRQLVAIDANGRTKPCSFAHSITQDQFDSYLAKPTAPCNGCAIQAVCRGGCKIVSQHLKHTVSADPECPKVRKYQASVHAVDDAVEALHTTQEPLS
jgi:radical SAM protein with 4Fe4S-binding SPASM domain